MKRTTLLAATLGAALLLTGCGDTSGPTGVGSVGAPTLAIHNGADHSTWYIQTRSCGTAGWSQDLLGASVVSTGQNFHHPVAQGCHDVRLRTSPDLKGEVIWSGVEFASSDTTTMMLDSWSYAR